MIILLLLTRALCAVEPFAGAALHERIGERISDDLALVDSDGRPVTFGSLRGGKPMILVPAYYGCPMLCGLVLDGLAHGLHDLGWTPGETFAIAAVSFDPTDGPAAARARRAAALATLGRGQAVDWPFLTGHAPAVAQLLAEIGMTISRDAASGQIAHPAAVLVITRDGRIARYLLGIEFPARDLRLALTEAGEGRIGSRWDRALLFCYHYDPATHRYGFAVANGLRLGAGASAMLAALLVTLAIRRHRRQRASAPTTSPVAA